MDDSFLQQLECPVCFDYCKAPIFQCVNGHNMCGQCRAKVSVCGICRAPMSNARNWFAESVSEKMTPSLPPIPAPALSFANEKQYKCYMSVREDTLHYFREQCKWQGKISELLPHIMICHPGGGDYGDTMDLSCKLNFELRSGTVYPKMLSLKDELFWCMLYYFPETQLLCLYVKKIRENSTGFVCEFTMEKGEQKLVYRQTPLSIDEDIRVGNKTLQLTRGMVDTFTDSTTGLFQCKVNIMLCTPAKVELVVPQPSAPSMVAQDLRTNHMMWTKGKPF